MNSTLLFIIKFILVFLPDTRCFGIKRALYRFAGVKVGKNVRICSSAKISGNGNLSIGDNTWIGHDAMIICSSNISIGSNVDIAPRVYIGTGTHVIDVISENIAGKGNNKDVVIEDGCWLGVQSVILPGVTVKSKNVVAAGAVVTKTFEPLVMLAGVPATIIKDLKS